MLDTDADVLPEESDAWYDHQLVGLKTVRDGVTVGEVIRVDHMPAQDLLIIKTTEGNEVMLPFVKAMVASVDVSKGIMVVTPPTGIFEEVLPELATPEPANASEEVDAELAKAAGIADVLVDEAEDSGDDSGAAE